MERHGVKVMQQTKVIGRGEESDLVRRSLKGREGEGKELEGKVCGLIRK